MLSMRVPFLNGLGFRVLFYVEYEGPFFERFRV